jgi:hypothetical protein
MQSFQEHGCGIHRSDLHALQCKACTHSGKGMSSRKLCSVQTDPLFETLVCILSVTALGWVTHDCMLAEYCASQWLGFREPSLRGVRSTLTPSPSSTKSFWTRHPEKFLFGLLLLSSNSCWINSAYESRHPLDHNCLTYGGCGAH